jgi:phenylacetate-CoA ligase
MVTEKLTSHFTIVKKSELFKEHYKNVNKISEIVPLEKNELREVLKKHFNLQKESKGVYLVRSGGSSTKPLIFPVDIQENLYQRKLLAIELVKYGMFSSKTIAINLFSYKGMYRTAAIVDDILEKCDATTISLGAASSFELVFNSATQFKANMLMGTPSKLTLLAKYIIDNNLNLAIENIMYAGEFLLASQAKLLKKAFKNKKIYSLYGSAETGIWGWSTYSEKETSFEVLDAVIIEIDKKK